MDELNKVLFELFGDIEEKKLDFLNDQYRVFTNDSFRIDVYQRNGIILVSADLKNCFDKSSRSPINFYFSKDKPLSRRKKRRIHEGINFLIRNCKIAGEFFGEMPKFDDLGGAARREFYALSR